MMKSWMDLGVVETIYEEEQEDASISSPLNSTVFLSLQMRVDEWTRSNDVEPDVEIHVQERCFQLHKDPLTSCSAYLRRHLTASSGNSVIIPSKITSDTFAIVAAFCYDSNVVITPFNFASLRLAAELLDMTDEISDGDENLIAKTESYFRQMVVAGGECVQIALRSCLKMMPEAEETARLPSRCIEALTVLGEIGDGCSDGWIDGVSSLTAEEFQVITESMRRFTRSHDALYKVVSHYLKQNYSKLGEDEKNLISASIDCNKLSPQLLIHAIQNPKMPLRFIIQAMLAEHFNTRRSVITVASAAGTHKPRHDAATLGAILHRDAALRHAAQLKASMETTNEKIRSLESDLMGMKKKLHESSELTAKAASFRFSSEDDSKRKRRGGGLPLAQKTSVDNSRKGKGLGRKLINGLKNVFRLSKIDQETEIYSDKKDSRNIDGDGDGDGDENGDKEEEKSQGFHRRTRSFT